MLEVIISFALLSFMALGVISLFSTSGHLNKLAQNRSVATSLASGRITEIRTLPFRSAANYLDYKLPEETATAGPPQIFDSGYGTIPGYPDFRRTVQLDYDSPVAGLLRVKVTVIWDHPTQGERSHDLITFLRPGI